MDVATENMANSATRRIANRVSGESAAPGSIVGKSRAGAGVLSKFGGSLRREPLLLYTGAEQRNLGTQRCPDKKQSASPGGSTSIEKANAHRMGGINRHIFRNEISTWFGCEEVSGGSAVPGSVAGKSQAGAGVLS